MRWILLPLMLLAFLFVQISPVSAAPSFSASAQFVRTRNVVRGYFSNLKSISSVSYTLMYQANGVGQGAMGSFKPGKSKSVSRDIYLGTCSGRVCTPHRNIKNMQLQVIAKYTNGKSSTKVIKVK